MAASWYRLCRGQAYSISGREILVDLHGRRRHRVTVDETDSAYRLQSTVVGATIVDQIDDLALRTWMRNRNTELVGFRFDRRGRLIGESWVPKVGLSASEFQLYVASVAAECDRYEFELTGRDL